MFLLQEVFADGQALFLLRQFLREVGQALSVSYDLTFHLTVILDEGRIVDAFEEGRFAVAFLADDDGFVAGV